MCHDILKEEDDEVVSLDETSDDCVNDKPLNDLLDEQNGNISAKLTQLTLNDDTVTDETVAASLNGNPIASDNNDRQNATKNKKKSKKGANSINNAGKLSADNDCDSNDNKLEEGDNTATTDDRLAQPGVEPIKDDAVDVHA